MEIVDIKEEYFNNAYLPDQYVEMKQDIGIGVKQDIDITDNLMFDCKEESMAMEDCSEIVDYKLEVETRHDDVNAIVHDYIVFREEDVQMCYDQVQIKTFNTTDKNTIQEDTSDIMSLSNGSTEVKEKRSGIVDIDLQLGEISKFDESYKARRHCCNICDKEFIGKAYLNLHLKIHSLENNTESATVHKCTNCDEQKQVDAPSSHEICTAFYPRKRYQCELCNKTYVSSGSLAYHILKHNNTQSYECELCEKKLISAGNLAKHMLIAHKGSYKLATCEICNKEFKQNNDHKIHMLTHSGLKLHQCEQCGRQFTRKNDLKSHIFTHTGIKRYKCELCNKNFSRFSGLKTHILTHGSAKSYKCDICNKNFSQCYYLKRHMLSHSGHDTRKHECDICGKRFSRHSYLQTHKSLHDTDIEKHKSAICDQQFGVSAKPKKHVLSHSSAGMKLVMCYICGKKMSHTGNLKNHILTHSNAKSHECHICGKAFNILYYLRNHMKIHSGNKSYKCEICNKVFVHPSYLRVHVLTHNAVKSYMCEICGKKFITAKYLRNHIARHVKKKN